MKRGLGGDGFVRFLVFFFNIWKRGKGVRGLVEEISKPTRSLLFSNRSVCVNDQTRLEKGGESSYS